MIDEACLVFGKRGTIAEVIEYIKELKAHAGNKDIGYLLKHRMIRLDRRKGDDNGNN